MATCSATVEPGIPAIVKAFTGVLILAGIFFAYVFAFNPGLTFPGAAITDYSSQLAFYGTGVRVIGSVVGLVIALALNSPRLLAIMLATRLVIEVGDIVVGIATGGTVSNNIMIGVIAVLEALAIAKLLQVIKEQEGGAERVREDRWQRSKCAALRRRRWALRSLPFARREVGELFLTEAVSDRSR